MKTLWYFFVSLKINLKKCWPPILTSTSRSTGSGTISQELRKRFSIFFFSYSLTNNTGSGQWWHVPASSINTVPLITMMILSQNWASAGFLPVKRHVLASKVPTLGQCRFYRGQLFKLGRRFACTWPIPVLLRHTISANWWTFNGPMLVLLRCTILGKW